MSRRPLEEWADWKYIHNGEIVHVVPYGEYRALCNFEVEPDAWYGTGDWSEMEYAQELEPCERCVREAVA